MVLHRGRLRPNPALLHFSSSSGNSAELSVSSMEASSLTCSRDFPPPSAPQSPTLPISSLPQWFQFLFMNWVMLSLLQGLIESSECVQMEYIAGFVAFLFPGALVAFDSESLQPLSCFAALRIYCAGIWHNAVCCSVCGLALLLLPFFLFPFYIHGLGVPSTSPLSGYLSPGDVIVSVDGVPIHNVQEWVEKTALINELARRGRNHSLDVQGFGTVNRIKGYCVPNSMMEESKQILIGDNQSFCPDDLSAFAPVPCDHTSILDHNHPTRIEKTHCLNAKNVVKRNKCGDGWAAITIGSNCVCSQEESCLSPVQIPGLIWVEITYSRPYSLECLRVRRKCFVGPRISDSMESNCGGTFVFVGDVISMARSVKLTAYRPLWAFPLGTYLPNVLERILICTFQVSLTLALLNSLLVYFLDGESILETTLCHFALLCPRKRRKVLQVCLLGGDTHFHPGLLQDPVIYFVSKRGNLCSFV